jgi:hypothetical protein
MVFSFSFRNLCRAFGVALKLDRLNEVANLNEK